MHQHTPAYLRVIAYIVSISMLFSGCSISPQPLTEEEVKERVDADIAAIEAGAATVDGTPISLYEAIARALKYNLDHRLKVMEQALSSQQLDLARYDLLPQLTAKAGYNSRSEYDGSSSMSLLDGSESLVPSTSTEKDIRTADITFMWNVLDFGVSYYRARQQADRVLILEERRRKVIQNIVQDVRYAYWRAVSAERLIKLEVLQRLTSKWRHGPVTRLLACQKLEATGSRLSPG